NARRLAEGLAVVRGVGIDPATVDTNIVIFDVDDPDGLCEALAARGVDMTPAGPRTVRAVTHLDVDRAGIERALAAVAAVLGSLGPEPPLRVPSVRRGLRLRGGPADVAIIAEIARLGGRYERRTMAVLARLLGPDHVAIDAGAHIGAMTLAMAALAPRGRVHAFEPAAVSATLARENVARNGLGNVEVHRLALDEREGVV